MIFLIVILLSYLLPFLWVLYISIYYDDQLGRYLATLAKLALVPPVATLVATGFSAPFDHGRYCSDIQGGMPVCSAWDHVVLQTDFTVFTTLVFSILWFGFLALIAITTLVLHWIRVNQAINRMMS